MDNPPLTPRKRLFSSRSFQAPARPAPLVRHDGSRARNTRASTSTLNASRTPVRARTATRSRARAATATRTRTRTGTATTDVNDEFVVALIDNNVKEVGVCIYNLHSFDVELRQYADFGNFSRTLAILNVFDPIEVLLSNSSVMGLLDQAIQASHVTKRIKVCFRFLFHPSIPPFHFSFLPFVSALFFFCISLSVRSNSMHCSHRIFHNGLVF